MASMEPERGRAKQKGPGKMRSLTVYCVFLRFPRAGAPNKARILRQSFGPDFWAMVGESVGP